MNYNAISGIIISAWKRIETWLHIQIVKAVLGPMYETMLISRTSYMFVSAQTDLTGFTQLS